MSALWDAWSAHDLKISFNRKLDVRSLHIGRADLKQSAAGRIGSGLTFRRSRAAWQGALDVEDDLLLGRRPGFLAWHHRETGFAHQNELVMVPIIPTLSKPAMRWPSFWVRFPSYEKGPVHKHADRALQSDYLLTGALHPLFLQELVRYLEDARLELWRDRGLLGLIKEPVELGAKTFWVLHEIHRTRSYLIGHLSPP